MAEGRHFMYKGEEFVCTSYNGFMLTADNVDKTSNLANIMWVGCVEQTMEEDSFKLL